MKSKRQHAFITGLIDSRADDPVLSKEICDLFQAKVRETTGVKMGLDLDIVQNGLKPPL